MSNKEKPTHPFYFDFKPGFFLGWFLYRLFRRVHFDESRTEDLKQMNRDGTVVYAIKYRGHLDYLLYHFRFRRSRLPYPKIAFDLNMSWFLPLSHLFKIAKAQVSYLLKNGEFPSPYENGFFKGLIEEGTTSLLCLVDPKGFSRQFVRSEKDQISLLLETQREMERPIYIVPQLILYKNTPEKENSGLLDIFFGFKDHPGVIRKIFLFFRHNRRAFIDFGRPLDLKAYLEGQAERRSPADMASEVRQLLIESIDGQKRVILGPIMKSRQQLKEKVLKDPTVMGAIEKDADGSRKHSQKLRKKAGGYFDEIAADYNSTYVEVFERALKWFWNRIFEGIDVSQSEISRVREWARKGPVIYVPSHKSHIDYLVLNYVLHQHHMHIPRVAAGKNLAFWPMGHIFRKSGAFFIRRTFKGAKLYALVFARYVKALLEEGHPLEFFIEGGRSRSGKLILPKIGFLSILLKAHQEGFCDDLVFVPSSISYDRILEEKSFLNEAGGGKKESENFKQVIRARHFLARKYGKIYIRFGQPLSLNEYLAEGNVIGEDTHRDVAFHLIRCINAATLATPLSVVSAAILTRHRRGFYLSELVETGKILLDTLAYKQAQIANTLSNPEEAIQETLSLLIEWKVIDSLEDESGGEETFYYVDEEKKKQLEYYKNSIIHFFLPEAFVAISLLSGKEEIRTNGSILPDYLFLKELFKNEFIYESESEEEQIASITSRFLEKAYLARNGSPDGYKLTRLGFDALPLWAALAKTFLESYWIAARSFLRQDGKPRKESDLLKSMHNAGLKFHRMGMIDHAEAVSQLTFTNAMRYMNKAFVVRREEGEKSEEFDRLSRLIQRVYELSHFKS